MGSLSARKHFLHRRYIFRRRVLQAIALIFIVWNAIEVTWVRHLLLQADFTNKEPPRPSERIYIASLHWNSEPVLRSHWNTAIVNLAEILGPENIFVSIYESGSWDKSKDALRELDRELDRMGVQRNITLSKTTHRDELSVTPVGDGWIDTPQGNKGLRRIPYLARLRNLALRPLEDLSREGVTFNKILFVDDAAFTAKDVLTLLNTNGGTYAAACALDFSIPPRYYDTFALRDSDGHGHLMQTWPFFRSSVSRDATKSFSPVPVASCWNGMVSMPAEPFISSTPLRFRAIPDSLAISHLEGSECCLIHADNPLSAQKGVYLNPNVRVGYDGSSFETVRPIQYWLSFWRIARGLWENRLRRWTTLSIFTKESVVRKRVQKWKNLSKQNHEHGEFCLIDEMQVLVAAGWIHV